jgi:hypothetical protein
MPTSTDYLRGDATVDPYRNRMIGGAIRQLRTKISFAVQCSKCGRWRKIITDNLPVYRFICFSCNHKGKMKKYNFYQFNYRELPLGTNHDLYIKKLNDEVR